MDVGTLLTRLAVDLNDAEPGHEFTTWTREQLRGYITEALQAVFSFDPGLFTREVVIKLEPCTESQNVCSCSDIRSVIGQSTADGRVLSTVRKVSSDPRLQWPGAVCASAAAQSYSVAGYSIDPVTKKLRVKPAPPPGQDYYLLVECAAPPNSMADTDAVPDKYLPAVVQYALWRAKSVDNENSQYTAAMAALHEKSFWRLLLSESLISKKYLATDTTAPSTAAQTQTLQAAQG